MSTNFAEVIEERADGEPIEAIVIGSDGWHLDEPPDLDAFAPCHWPLNVMLDWATARPHLDHDWDNGYGAPGCPAITAWTANRVIFVSQYDGSTSVDSVPRNPVDHTPIMPGG